MKRVAMGILNLIFYRNVRAIIVLNTSVTLTYISGILRIEYHGVNLGFTDSC